MTLKIDGNNLTYTDNEGDSFDGTLENGILCGVYADMEYRYVKDVSAV